MDLIAAWIFSSDKAIRVCGADRERKGNSRHYVSIFLENIFKIRFFALPSKIVNESLRLGCNRITTFEKYSQVIDLARKNPFSPLFEANLQSANPSTTTPRPLPGKTYCYEHLVHRPKLRERREGKSPTVNLFQGVDLERPRNLLWDILSNEGVRYHSCVLDPPKRPSSLVHYLFENTYPKEELFLADNQPFCSNLAEFLELGSMLSVYVPDSPGSRNSLMQQTIGNIASSYEMSRKFKFRGSFKNHRNIFLFERADLK